jgi:hypothetical protein
MQSGSQVKPMNPWHLRYSDAPMLSEIPNDQKCGVRLATGWQNVWRMCMASVLIESIDWRECGN